MNTLLYSDGDNYVVRETIWNFKTRRSKVVVSWLEWLIFEIKSAHWERLIAASNFMIETVSQKRVLPKHH